MTIDLRTARPGSVVEFRCGGKAVVEDTLSPGEWVRMSLKGAYGSHSWQPDGRYTMSGDDIWDIVAIHPPPMTDAERLAEIATLASESRPMSHDRTIIMVDMLKILALAQGRMP